MKYNQLGKTGYEVSAITYGGIVSAVQYDGIISPEIGSSDEYVQWAIEHGINYFDVAPTYGDAELNLGKSLVPYRKDIYLACKTNKRTAKEARIDCEKTKELLHTDYFDVYQLHGICTMEEVEIAFGKGGVMELMEELKREGIARRIGFTAHSEEAALRMLELYDFDSVLFPYNWHMNQTTQMGDRLIKALKERNIGVLCMKSMIERAWRFPEDNEKKQRYPKSWCKPIDVEDEEFLIAALKYVAEMGVDTIIPPGNIHHFKFAVEHVDEIFDQPLTAQERQMLRERVEEVRAYPFF
ncbi:MAG: aldo/keto reductase [Eubacteriales bacterium]|nr:aldo/keto reductase [Eubacteriales bacterium]